jgi:hypothetical protein
MAPQKKIPSGFDRKGFYKTFIDILFTFRFFSFPCSSGKKGVPAKKAPQEEE